MPTQTDVQKLIQGLVPGSVNNGNPNTAYNVAPPTMDADGNWFAATMPSAASINGLTRQAVTGPSAWTAPEGSASTGGGGFVFPQMPDLGSWEPPSGWVTKPKVPPAGQEKPTPVTNPPKKSNGGGSIRPPSVTNPRRGTDILGADVQRYANRLGASTGERAGRNGVLPGTSNDYSGYFGLNSKQNFDNLMDTLANSNGGLAGFLQGAELGSMGGFLEVLDKVSEPWLQGDFVQGGNFNWRQLANAMGNKLAPASMAAIAKLLGKGDEYSAWLAGGYGDLPGNYNFGSALSGNNNFGYKIGQTNPITGTTNWGLGNSNGGIFDPGGSVSFWNNATNNANLTSFTPEQTVALQNAAFGISGGGGGGGRGSGGGFSSGGGGGSGISGSGGSSSGGARQSFLDRSAK